MSAQRRTATKQQRTATVNRPASSVRPAAETSAARPAKPAPVKEKPAQERQSALNTRAQSLRKLILDTWAEIKKISWPDGPTVRNLTALVIAMSTFLGLSLGGIDFVLLKLFDLLS